MTSNVEEGQVTFSIEARLLRELGERLVRQPEVALVELIKNSYDADATTCSVQLNQGSIVVRDDGHGMTFDLFRDAWMRVGTSNKSQRARTAKYSRPITGEKGIGRFAARFLGSGLGLATTAYDAKRGSFTELRATFDWPAFDAQSDLNDVTVPYQLTTLEGEVSTGTTLKVTRLRRRAETFDLGTVRTRSLGVVSPLRSLMRDQLETHQSDPGFSLILGEGSSSEEDIAHRVLDHFTLRSTIDLGNDRLKLVVQKRDGESFLEINDRYESNLGSVYADIRFFPRRSGSFTDLGLDGRVAYSWIRENAGVNVFDRGFRVSPYGDYGDDWLSLASDTARNLREPRSTIASTHFEMSDDQRNSTAENWMLRLPESAQLIGVVQVSGQRFDEPGAVETPEGLVAAADREGFIDNEAYRRLVDLIRGAVEAIAFADRRIQLQDEERAREARAKQLQEETRRAIAEIEADKTIPAAAKKRFVGSLLETAERAELQQAASRERERQLETMSLLGVLAGFMTHEFGSAIAELEEVVDDLDAAGGAVPSELSMKLRRHIANLEQYVQYSTAYIRGSNAQSDDRGFPVLPRVRQVVKVFKDYADARRILIEVGIRSDLMAPPVPAAFYSGVVLNLFSNALKAVTATSDPNPTVAVRAWNDARYHFLEVSDNGIGIPASLRERVFDPLFTTTASRNDPLGSGLGLGLSLVRRTVETFGGLVAVVDPPPGFVTSFRVRLDLA